MSTGQKVKADEPEATTVKFIWQRIPLPVNGGAGDMSAEPNIIHQPPSSFRITGVTDAKSSSANT